MRNQFIHPVPEYLRADYTVWRDSLGSKIARYFGADGSGNGIVNEADFAIWNVNFGHTFGSGPGASANAAVPEPATFVLLILAVAFLSPARRQRLKNLSYSIYA